MKLLAAKSSVRKPHEMTALFQGAAIPRSCVDRPLGGLSDFVAEILPELCLPARASGSARAALERTLHVYIKSHPQVDPFMTSEQNMELACLDLTLLQAAWDHLDLTLPRPLTESLQDLTQKLGRTDAFLYEDCVLINPLTQDPRLFSASETGKSERDFLLIHSEIEATLKHTLERILQILGLSTIPVMPNREFDLQSTQAELDWVEQLFCCLRRMKPELFALFRPFYASSPRSSAPGPSGRYSGKFYLLRVLTEGDALDQVLPAYRTEVRQSIPYFPRYDREFLKEWAESPEGRSRLPCLRIAANRDPDLTPLLQLIRRSLDRFTALHYGLVHRNLVTYRAGDQFPHERRHSP